MTLAQDNSVWEQNENDRPVLVRTNIESTSAWPSGLTDDSMDVLPFSIALVDLRIEDCPIVYVNRAFEALTGYHRSTLIGQNCRLLQGPETDQEQRREMREAIAERRDASVDIANYRANGEMFINRVQLTPLPRTGTAATHYLGTQTEISLASCRDPQIQKLDQALREMQHRVKNHLSMLLALIRLESGRATDAKSSLEVLAHRVESLNLLYDELSLRDVHEKAVVGIGAYLARVASSLNMLDGRSHVSVNIETEQLSGHVDAASQVGLLLSELLTNALKHAFAGSEIGQVDVRFWCEGEFVYLRVRDTGSGLPAGCDWPRKGNLGARIVSDLVRRLEAQLDVTSGPQGTDVIVTIPGRLFITVE